MAKKNNGPADKKPSAKKSAIPYTPEVVPAAAPPAQAAPKPAAAAPPAAAATTPPVAAPASKQVTSAASKAAPQEITWELISERAYFISISGSGSDQDSNWHQAVAELNREAGNK